MECIMPECDHPATIRFKPLEGKEEYSLCRHCVAVWFESRDKVRQLKALLASIREETEDLEDWEREMFEE